MELNDLYWSMEVIPGVDITDKGKRHPFQRHFYMDIYDRLFSPLKDKPIKIFELGISRGASIQLWSTFFKNGVVSGLDDKVPPRKDYLDTLPNVQLAYANAYDEKVADKIIEHFPKQDIFIDDGLHDIESQKFALKHYSKMVDKGGMYIIEDITPPEFQKLLYCRSELHRRSLMEIYDYTQRDNAMADDIMLVLQFEE